VNDYKKTICTQAPTNIHGVMEEDTTTTEIAKYIILNGNKLKEDICVRSSIDDSQQLYSHSQFESRQVLPSLQV
jgi:hypothetical protein